MRLSQFFKLGEFIYRFRILMIAIWLLAILGCIPFLKNITTPFNSTGFVAKNSESSRTHQFVSKHIGYNVNRFVIIYHSAHLKADQPKFINKLKHSLSDFKNFPLSHEIIYPDANKKQISADKHTAYAVILIKSDQPLKKEMLTRFKSLIKTPEEMSIRIGGEPIFIESINKQTQQDLSKADLIAAPISLLTLLIVFGTVVAAFVPIFLGGGCALMILSALYGLGHFFSLSIFTLNIALLLGLCLSLDYALFIISRFRDELRNDKNVERAIAVTLATAGKAIFFSGLAVFISLSALLLFPINILFSVGIGGLVAVFLAVAIALTLLPAILAVLGLRINKFALYNTDAGHHSKTWRFWHKLAIIVVKSPFRFLFSTLLVILLLGYPFLKVQIGISDFHILPPHTEGRAFFNTYQEKFNLNELSPILVVVTTHKSILTQKNLEHLYGLSKKIKQLPNVAQVNSIVSMEPSLSTAQYYALYHTPKHLMPKNIQQLLKTTTREHVTLMTVISKYDANAPQTKELVRQLRDLQDTKDFNIHLTGSPVNNVDVLTSIKHIFPYAMAWILILTYCILLILLRSLFLPFKAIAMTILSLCASYGVLVFIFQEGHLSGLLNFNTQEILDVSLLTIIFCALFGFSMDYEVFLLSRIHEFYIQTNHNRNSIIFGITKSSRIITSAALIVICICASFMTADVIMVKQFGLGIAIAIFVDAFLIRSLLVPSIMVLFKSWNWYLPDWLARALPDSSDQREVKNGKQLLQQQRIKKE